MNYMGGGRRDLKVKEKDSERDTEQVLSYIQKRLQEKKELEAKGLSIFKADDVKLIGQSQDIKRTQMMQKIFSKPTKRSAHAVRHVLVERSNPTRVRKPTLDSFKAKLRPVLTPLSLKMAGGRVKQSSDKKYNQTTSEMISSVNMEDKIKLAQHRIKMTREWIARTQEHKERPIYVQHFY